MVWTDGLMDGWPDRRTLVYRCEDASKDIFAFTTLSTTRSFTRTDEKYGDTAAQRGFIERWVGS